MQSSIEKIEFIGILSQFYCKDFKESIWVQNFMHDDHASWINDAESKLEDTAQAINNKRNWKSPCLTNCNVSGEKKVFLIHQGMKKKI